MAPAPAMSALAGTGGTGNAGLNDISGNTDRVTGGTAGADGSAGGHGGNGGSADANATDMVGVGAIDNVSIHGGDSGQGGVGYDDYHDDVNDALDRGSGGDLGGNGGAGGHASLDWGSGDQRITSLDVVAGQTKSGQLGWRDRGDYDPDDLCELGTEPSCRKSSGSGQGGYARFELDGILTTNSTVNVQAQGNYAEFESNGLIANGATTITSTGSSATMDIHGNAMLTTLTVTSGGSGLASFVADGTGAVTTTGVTDVIANSTGRAEFESVSYHGGDTTDITANNAGDASFVTGKFASDDTVTIQANSTGNATMTVNDYQDSVVSKNNLTVDSTNAGNATLRANQAGTVEVTNNLNVTASGSGQALLEANIATVSVGTGHLNVTSSTNSNGTATVQARVLSNSGQTNITARAADASIILLDTGSQLVTTGTLNLAANGIGNASFIADSAENIHTQAINITGAATGDAIFQVREAEIHTTNKNVDINATAASSGIMGIDGKNLNTGSNTGAAHINNGTVTLENTAVGATAWLTLSDSLQTRELILDGNTAADSVIVNINRVDATYLDETAFNFTNTVASIDEGATGVYFKTIDLGNDTQVRTLDATNAGLGTYWADTLKVNLTSAPTTGQQWVGDLWLGGSPYDGGLLAASGTVGVMDVMLPAGTNLADYYGTGDGGNSNYMLAVNGNLTLEDGAAVNLKAVTGNPFKDLNVDEQLQIVSSTNAITDHTTDGVAVNGYSELGASTYLFDMLVSDDGEKLLAKFLGGELNVPVAKTYLEGVTAALGTINLGAELENRVLRNSFDPYSNSGLFKNGSNLGVMFGLEYTDMRLNSGSHVDSDNMNIVIGPALRSENALGRLGLGLFFEAGYGDYSAHNSFPTLEVIGEGETKYFGGGLGLRHDFARGFYTDLSMRAGSVTTDLKIKDRLGAEYDMSTSYFGGHAGFGKIFDFEDSGRLDLSARLLWARLGGDEVMTRADERLSIDDAKSLRTQLGARYSRSFNDTVAGYVGGAWEYESDGTVSGHLDDVRIDEPSLKGSTGIAEVGFSLTPGNNVSIDLGLQGYTGQREGAGGTAMLSVSF